MLVDFWPLLLAPFFRHLFVQSFILKRTPATATAAAVAGVTVAGVTVAALAQAAAATAPGAEKLLPCTN